jgi:hypothetical protein
LHSEAEPQASRDRNCRRNPSGPEVTRCKEPVDFAESKRTSSTVTLSIIPAFAVRWLKKTSFTGRIKNLTSKVALQESKRVYLLCSDCEQLISKDEKLFSEKIFIPYHEGKQSVFEYGTWLKRFIIGLHWRVLVTREDQYPPHVEAVYAKAETDWRAYLLNHSAYDGGAEFHLFLADVIKDATWMVPEKLNWYFARGFDGTPLYSEAGMAGVYAKVIKVMTFCYLSAKPPGEELHGTLIADEGVLTGGQVIKGRLGPFINDRVKKIERLPKTMSARQTEKLLARPAKEPEWFLQSESFRTFRANEELKETLHRRLRKETKRMKGSDRNSPCPCGSGKKFKKCHGQWAV